MRIVSLIFFLALCFAPVLSSIANSNNGYLLELKGAVTPATNDYIHRGIINAQVEKADLVIIEMDTPGGLDQSMRNIIRDILSSSVPVVTYVSPSGARAASAGTYILYASHIAAMAPGTNLGAATPVQIGGMPEMPQSPTDEGKKQEKPAVKDDPMSKKMVNDASAYIRGLAEMRNRNAEWAEKAVREAASLTATEALQKNVIDIVAKDLTDLLEQIHGKTVTVKNKEVTLDTQGLNIIPLEPDWRNKLLSIITDPNIAYILMLIGIYGLIFEFANPGYVLPGVAGAICLILALYAFQVLPINYAGLALIILGILFMVAEAFMPSFGALGFGGAIAFLIGSLILFDADIDVYPISLPLIGSFTLLSAAFFIGLIGMAIKARQRPVVTGQEEMIGAVGTANEDFEHEGNIHVHGENWHARTSEQLRKGDAVAVTGMDGLILEVRPKKAIDEYSTKKDDIH